MRLRRGEADFVIEEAVCVIEREEGGGLGGRRGAGMTWRASRVCRCMWGGGGGQHEAGKGKEGRGGVKTL